MSSLDRKLAHAEAVTARVYITEVERYARRFRKQLEAGDYTGTDANTGLTGWERLAFDLEGLPELRKPFASRHVAIIVAGALTHDRAMATRRGLYGARDEQVWPALAAYSLARGVLEVARARGWLKRGRRKNTEPRSAKDAPGTA